MAAPLTMSPPVPPSIQQGNQEAERVLLDLASVFLNSTGVDSPHPQACEKTSGYRSSEVTGKPLWDLFVNPDETVRFREIFERFRCGGIPEGHESTWTARHGTYRVIDWSSTALTGARGALEYVILTGIDVTAAKSLERSVLEVSGREQRRIGRDLHDGLGQHLSGVLDVRPGPDSGTLVCCFFPASNVELEEGL